jgi:hypothetical protein
MIALIKRGKTCYVPRARRRKNTENNNTHDGQEEPGFFQMPVISLNFARAQKNAK